MKNSWQTKTLGDLFDITSSKRVFESDWKREGVPFYRAREIVKLAKQGFVDNELFISEEMFKQYSTKYGIPAPSDIMVTGVGTLGICYVVKEGDRFYFKDGNIIWLKKKSDTDSRFVEYAFQSDFLRSQIDDSVGATVGTFTIIKAKNTCIPVPPLSEQQRIVGILDEVFAGLATATANAEKNLQNARALFESHLQSVLLDKNWKWKTLGDLCAGVEYGSSAKSKTEGRIPVLRMGNIQDGKLDWEKLVYTDDKEEIEKYLLKHNDVLFNRTNSPELVGKTAIYKSEMPAIFAGYLIRIHRNEDLLDADYLNYFLNSQIALDYGKTVVISSVNQANINGAKLKGYPIPSPSLAEQKIIVKKLNALSVETQRLESIYEQKLAALEALKKSLLHHAFTGQL